MRKPFNITLLAAVAGILAMGTALAQQNPPASTAQTPPSGSSQSSAPKTTAPKPAAKTGSSTSTAKKTTASPPLTLKTDKEKASYAIGMNMGEGMRKQSVEVDPAILLRGLKDGLAGGKKLLTDEEARTVLIALQNEVRKQQQEKFQAQSEANKKAGDTFLAANKAKEGVVALPSGLQYKVLQEGSGEKPAATDTVNVNYKGTLLDGTEFDSSAKHGSQPAQFQVNRLTRGWVEALQLMPVGSKWQLFVPPDLGYGQRGTPDGSIGPNSTLVFEVQLVSIQPKPPAPQPAPSANANAAPNATPNSNPGATSNPAPPAGSGANPNPHPAPNAPAKPNPTPPSPTPTPTPTRPHQR